MTDQTPAQNQCGCGCSEPNASNAGRTSCAALWSMICGIVGMLTCLPAVPAIILGIIGLINIKKSNGMLKGSGKAITGIILGGLAILVWPFLLIAAIAIPNLMHARDVASEMKARAEIINISQSIEMYYVDYGVYPTAEQGLDVLLKDDQGHSYLDKISNDPWGRPYHYRYPGNYNPESFDLWSDGRDGIEGTEDDLTSGRE